MPEQSKSVPDFESATASAVATLDELVKRHYKSDLASLLSNIETPLGRRQFSRLLGVMVKTPFAVERPRHASESTGAIFALDWKDDKALRSIASETWQFDFMLALMSEEGGGRIQGGDAYAALTYYKYESSLGKFIFQAFRKRICGDPANSKALRNAIAEAKKSGVKLIDPTTESISVGLASTVAVAVATLLPATIAAVGAPVIGGIALLLIRVGVDGFCDWSRQVVEEAEKQERADS